MLPAEYEIYAAIAGGFLVILVLLFVFVLSINISRKRRMKLEKEIIKTHYRTREETLLQVSRDLHDDIGASLSGIQLFNELLQRQMQLEDFNSARMMSEKIALYIKEISESVADMAWLFKQGDHNIEVLISKLERYAADMGGTKNITFHPIVSPEILAFPLSLLQQKNCYLICKEAINNAVKYSGCTRIELAIKSSHSVLTISVSDNGKGLDENIRPNGNGLQNIKQRAGEMEGTCSITNNPAGGVKILLEVPLNQSSPR